MPTYEKRNADGDVVERTVTLPAGHPTGYDEQMAKLAADESTPWHQADDFPTEAHSDPNPTLVAAVPSQPTADLATGGLIAADTGLPFAHDDPEV